MTLKKLFIIAFFPLLSQCTSLNNNQEIISKDIPQEARILFGGDLMLDWGIQEVITEHGPDYPVKNIKDFLHSFDYRFCNLECPISDKEDPRPEKKFVFRGRPEHIALLKSAGINGVSLANNHACDYGKDGLLDTIDNLSKNGIGSAGAGRDMGAAHLPLTITINGINLAVLAYSSIAYSDSFADKDNPGVARAKIELITDDIKQYKAFNDFIIVSIHWGFEYSEYPEPKDIKLAHAIIKSGADAIIGHHPHIFQGIEIYEGKPIFYSLGNFVFGSINENAMENILVEIYLLKDKIKSLRIFPINGNGNTDTPFQYTLLKGIHAVETLKKLVSISKLTGSGETSFTKNAEIKGDCLEYNFE
ncbi:MAG: CapA family protein [Spirochaetes bacterium]|nr:CapA family protein [Spirochaetota bacterium]